MTMKCPSCGRDSEGANFCPDCGTRLIQTEPESRPEAPQFMPRVPAPPGITKLNGEEMPPDYQQIPAWPPPKKMSTAKAVWIIVGTLVACVAVMVVILRAVRFDGPTPSKSEISRMMAEEYSQPDSYRRSNTPEVVLEGEPASQTLQGVRFEVPASWESEVSEDEKSLYYFPLTDYLSMISVNVDTNDLHFTFDSVEGRAEYEAFFSSVFEEDEYEKINAYASKINGHKAMTITYSYRYDGADVLCEESVFSVGGSLVSLGLVVFESRDEKSDFYALQEEFHAVCASLDCSGLEE